MGSNLQAVLEMSQSSGSLTIPRGRIGTRSWSGQQELALRIHYAQVKESAGDGASTMALKSMGRGNQSPKQRVPVAPQNGDIVTAKIKKKKKTSLPSQANGIVGGVNKSTTWSLVGDNTYITVAWGAHINNACLNKLWAN